MSNNFTHHLNNRNVIVTGGAGFIGSHLVKKLCSLGAHVTVIDTAPLPDLLMPFMNQISYIKADITASDAMVQHTSGHDTIFHCAAMASVAPSFEDPLLCMKLNIMGTANLLEAARRNNINRFIFSSSAAVYGPNSGSCHENMVPHPMSPYGFSKWHGELLCQEYQQLYGITTVSLRYFNVFSADMASADGLAPVYARFRYALSMNKPITLYGSGQQTRDFVAVDDVVQANILCGTAPQQFLLENGLLGNALNVGSGSSISLLQLFEKLKTEFPGYDQEPVLMPARPGDINHSIADCSKLDSLRKKAMIY